MKYIMSFNESISNLNDVVNDCKDILVDLLDHKITYNVYGYEGKSRGISKDRITIEIGDDRGVTSLINMDLPFEHLFYYLESSGFVLDTNRSFYSNSDWGSNQVCPECGSENLTYDDDDVYCNTCNISGYSDDFTSPDYKLDKTDLFYAIKMNKKFESMLIDFYRIKTH